jgi:kynurenine formamidase
VTSNTLNDDDVRAVYEAISNWGRWGYDDQLGTLNYITPAHRVAAAKLISEGSAIGLGRDVDTVPSPMNNIPAQHYMVAAGDVAPVTGAGVCYDQIGVFPHGQAQSHLDALCHISDNRVMFNGRPAALVTSKGAATLDICVASDGIVSRGVFLDIAAARGVPFIDPEDPVRPEDFDRAEELAGITVGEGDLLIYRTGRHERRETVGPECERFPDGRGNLPGIYPDCLEWIHERKVALIGSDCAHDVLPSPFENEAIPIHVGTEVYMGLLLLHNLQLAGLQESCKRLLRNEFFLAVSPLRIAGGTASPVNPIALF